MRYLSLFSGIEAATVAWEALGWEAVGFAEFEDFPKAVLAHHYPNVPDLGDVTKITEEQVAALGPIDLVVGGSPCTGLSVSGDREGLANEQSSLFYEMMRIFEIARRRNGARWLVWENVAGALSSNGGADFREVLGAMAGWKPDVRKWARGGIVTGPRGLVEWRVLDAQHFGVPQRRRRVYAVLDTGDWASRQPILFEREGGVRLSAQGSGAGSRDTRGVGYRFYENHGNDSRLKEVDVCPTVTAWWGTGGNNVPLVLHQGDVRRLTVTEAERLQGFPDNYTNIPWANKPTAPDSRRYKALGNSMAVPVMRWIGERIQGAKSVVYDQYAISIAALPPLTAEEQEAGQGSLF